MVRYINDEGRDRARFLSTDNRYFRVFLEPNTGANGGGTGGQGNAQTGATGGGAQPNVTSQQAGQQGQQQQQQQASPWDTINWDELDEGTRTTLRAAQADHQRVARENATLAQQAEADRQRVAQMTQRPAPTQQQQTDPVEANIRETLKAQGYNQTQIDQQAPALAKVMGNLLPLFKASVGQDLAPLATTVIAQQNQNNFEAAMQTSAGQQLFADPELAQHVWTVVGQQTANGRTFDPDAILNFAKMAYFDRQQAAGQPAPAPILQPSSSSFFPTVAQQPAAPNRSTGFSFPGATLLRPLVTNTGNGSGGSHAVNADTQAALATTFSEMARTTGVAPKAFPSNLASRGGGAQKK